ncbi:MAG: enoyl-CoA hydratase/isomerase family protein [Sphingomonadales bacterium]
MVDAPVFIDKDGEIAWLVLNRPDKRNAMTDGMWRAVPELLRQAENDRDIKVLIVRGAGGDAFCAGADIAELKGFAADPTALDGNIDAIRAALTALAAMAKPTIAMIQGPCVGGGCALAVACDFRLTDPAGRFAITPAKLGLAYSVRETRRLVDLIGPSRAKEMLFTGRTFDAQQAFRIGLVNAVHAGDRLEAETLDLAGSICAVSQFSVRAIKDFVGLIEDGLGDDTEDSMKRARQAYDGEDHREGVTAFMEKRRPSFTFR